MSSQVQIYDDGESVAGADLSGSQYLAVKQSTAAAGAVVVNTTLGAPILGILQNKPAAGQPAQVRVLGRTKWIAGAAIGFGAAVMSDAAGKCVALATTGSVGEGFLSENIAASAANQVVSVILKFAGIHA